MIFFPQADERKELNAHPRRMQITKEIRDAEDAMEKIRRKIEDESSILQSLRHTADAQNALSTLQEQCEKDIDVLDENIREESYSLNKFDIQIPNQLPRADDGDGDQLSKVVDSIMQSVREKYNAVSSRLDKSKDEIVNTQKAIAEKSALLLGNQKTLTSVKSRQGTLENSVAIVRRTIEDLKVHEARHGLRLTVSDDNPRDLIKHIDNRLDELEEEAPDINATRVGKKILKRLAKKVRIHGSQTLT